MPGDDQPEVSRLKGGGDGGDDRVGASQGEVARMQANFFFRRRRRDRFGIGVSGRGLNWRLLRPPEAFANGPDSPEGVHLVPGSASTSGLVLGTQLESHL